MQEVSQVEIRDITTDIVYLYRELSVMFALQQPANVASGRRRDAQVDAPALFVSELVYHASIPRNTLAGGYRQS